MFSHRQAGFTYIVVLVALLVTGILAGIAYVPAQQNILRDREAELLFRGMAYQQAIQSYYEMNPLQKKYPRQLQDLLLDNRVSHMRHIRRLYNDPFIVADRAAENSHPEWVLLRNKKGGITGVASSSTKRPLKQKNFPHGYELLENAEHYSDWVFAYWPATKNSLQQKPGKL